MTASSMAHNLGKHPSAKEERKVLDILKPGFFLTNFLNESSIVPLHLVFAALTWFGYFFTAQKAAHWEKAAGEDKQLFGSAQRNRDRSVQAGREYCPYVSPLSKQRGLNNNWGFSSLNSNPNWRKRIFWRWRWNICRTSRTTKLTVRSRALDWLRYYELCYCCYSS